MKASAPLKISDAIGSLLSSTNLIGGYYFGHLGLYFEYNENASVPIAGVRGTSSTVVFAYNEKWLENASPEEVMFVYLHECLHIVAEHPTRIFYSALDHRASNIAADIVTNELILSGDVIPVKYLSAPIGIYRRPAEYKGEMILEDIYEWLMENPEELEKIDPEGNAEDIHESSGTIRGNVVDEIKQEMRNRGYESHDIHTVIVSITPARRDYLRELTGACAWMLGYGAQRMTYARPNRQGFDFMKGSRKISKKVVVVLDISCSMTDYERRRVLGVIITGNVSCKLYMVDTSIRKVVEINGRSELEAVEFLSGGGTVLQPSILVASKENPGVPIVVLTDGYTDNLDFSMHDAAALVVFTEDSPEIKGRNVVSVKLDS